MNTVTCVTRRLDTDNTFFAHEDARRNFAVSSEAVRTIKALSNVTRLLVMIHVAARESTVTELINYSNTSRLCMAQHLIRLRDNGLIIGRRQGRNILYSVARSEIIPIIDKLRELYNLEAPHYQLTNQITAE